MKGKDDLVSRAPGTRVRLTPQYHAGAVKLVVAPFGAPGWGPVHSRRSYAIGAPRADTNRGFRVSRSIFDATRQRGRLRHPRRTPRKAMVLLRRLQGRLVGSIGSIAVRFFDANGSGRLIPSAGAARHHPICPGPIPDQRAPRNQPMVDRIGPYGTSDIFELLLARQL